MFPFPLRPILPFGGAVTLCLVSLPMAAAACTPDDRIVRWDTLSAIALDETGSVRNSSVIHEINYEVTGANPNLIHVGDELDIPCTTEPLEDLNWSVMPRPEAVAALMTRVGVQVVDIRSDKAQSNGVLPGAIDLS